MNPIKLWVSYEKNLKKIDKVFKENMVQDKKTGVWRNKEMAKKELEKENRLLGKRCNQLLKDKGDLIDKIADIKANCDLAIEGKDVKIMELEQKLEQTEKDLADYQFNYPTIKELEQKNAELKARLNAINLLTPELEKRSNLKRQQLTKAAELLKETQGYIENIDDVLYDEIEQFLKEVEK